MKTFSYAEFVQSRSQPAHQLWRQVVLAGCASNSSISCRIAAASAAKRLRRRPRQKRVVLLGPHSENPRAAEHWTANWTATAPVPARRCDRGSREDSLAVRNSMERNEYLFHRWAKELLRRFISDIKIRLVKLPNRPGGIGKTYNEISINIHRRSPTQRRSAQEFGERHLAHSGQMSYLFTLGF